ncbi:MAG: cytochrome c1 [Alphaproteobacteria bacterium]|nr:cytochrome c1 [Alphaproteobacteria bacterium]
MNNRLFSFIALFVLVFAGSAYAAGEAKKPPQMEWSFNGPFGTYDKASLQRGYKIYREVCAACHSMKRVYFRNLEALGYNEQQIKNIAAEYNVMDGPNDEGEMFERPAIPADSLPSPFANEQAAKYANGGAYPPDLSLITKARHDGSNYVHALLIGYKDAPEGEEMSDTQHWNAYFPGHKISMAQPFVDGQIAYEDGSPDTVEQYAKDVTHFLTWAADPYMEERKRTGFRVIVFLIIFAGIMYAVKKKIWSDVH